jgi:hypothetical protein
MEYQAQFLSQNQFMFWQSLVGGMLGKLVSEHSWVEARGSQRPKSYSRYD